MSEKPEFRLIPGGKPTHDIPLPDNRLRQYLRRHAMLAHPVNRGSEILRLPTTIEIPHSLVESAEILNREADLVTQWRANQVELEVSKDIERFWRKNHGERSPLSRETIVAALIEREAEVGGSLFKPTPEAGSHFYFYCEDNSNWILREGYGKTAEYRYTVGADYIFQLTEDRPPVELDEKNARTLAVAAQEYAHEVWEELYAD